MSRTYTVVVTFTDDELAKYTDDTDVADHLRARLEFLSAGGDEAVTETVEVLNPETTAYVADCVSTDEGEHAPSDLIGDEAWRVFVGGPVDRR